MSTDGSDDHCGYRQNTGWESDSEEFVDDAQWGEDDESVICLRDPWTDHDRCIWHAEVEDKPTDALATARANEQERLDGAYMVDVSLEDQVSFDKCRLRKANLSKACLSGADLRDVDLSVADLEYAYAYADLPRVNLPHADLAVRIDLPRANLSHADLSGADLQSVDLSRAKLWNADLSGANLPHADLSEANLRSTNLFKIDVNSLQIDDIGDVTVDSRTKVSSRIPLRSGFRHVSSLLVEDLDVRWQATMWDGRARGYERLRRIFQEKGLDDHHRKLYSYQRRARAKEALRTGRFIQWIGNYLSRILTGHGVRITRVLLWTAVVILVPWYWYGLVEGWANESLDGGPLYYSIVTFVTSPPHPIPDTQGSTDLLLTTVDRQSLNQAIVLFQTYVGTVLIILLGYVLGNRDPI